MDIASITPSTWYAGQTYTVVVTGGFPCDNEIPAGGFLYLFGLSTENEAWGPDAGVNVLSVSYDTPTQITFTVQVPASTPTETAYVYFVNIDEPSLAGGPPIQIVGSNSAIITDASDIMNGIVTVDLTAPSGTTGDLNLALNGSDSTGLELSQAPFAALAPGSQDIQLPFGSILPGIYTIANGDWNPVVPPSSSPQTVTIPDYTLAPWTYFGNIFYTQYNVPHESQCSGGDGNAWIVSKSVVGGKTKCSFAKVELNSRFIAATWMNGTGVESDGTILKNAAAFDLGDLQKCAGQYPAGAIGHGKATGNTFAITSQITGSCGSMLMPDQSLARPVTLVGKHYISTILSNVRALSCDDQLNLDNGDHTTASTRSIDDICPACSDESTFHGADGHIDAFSSNESCTGGAVGNLGYFYTSYPTN